jgi:hypothetical protein
MVFLDREYQNARRGYFRASLHDGETAWSGSNSRGLNQNDGGARNGNPDGSENPNTAKATGAITNAEKLIGPAA